MQQQPSFGRKVKNLFIGKSLNLGDTSIFHNLSLVAFFAWVGLGSDGLSSSCYGPAEAYLALGEHTFLAIFVGLASVLTIFVISASYSQIIELFPSGGGGYVVASSLFAANGGIALNSTVLDEAYLSQLAARLDALDRYALWSEAHRVIAIARRLLGL